MRCNRARLLGGVRDELDAPTFRALKAHLRQCPDCAANWIEEDAFRRIVAERPAPRVSAGLTGALLAIPDRALGWQSLRNSLPPRGPALALALSLGLGALGLFWLGDASPRMDAPQGPPPPAFESAPDLRAEARERATLVPRMREAFVDGPRSLELDAGDAALPNAESAARRLVAGRAESGAPSITAAGERPRDGEPAPESQAPRARDEDERGGGPGHEIIAPTLTRPAPSATPSPSPAPVWELTLLALGGIEPIDDGVEVQAEIWSLGGEQERAVDELRMRFEDGEARVTLRSALPAPIEVSVYDGAGGLALCPGERRVRLVEADELASGPVELRILYCYPPRPTTAPSTTPTRAPATASPAPSETPEPRPTSEPGPAQSPSPEPSPPPLPLRLPLPSDPAPEPNPLPRGGQGSHRG